MTQGHSGSAQFVQTPTPGSSVHTSTPDRAPCRSPGDRAEWAPVAQKDAQLLSILQVPEAHTMVGTAREQAGALGIDGACMNGAGISLQDEETSESADIPASNAAVFSHADQQLSGWTEATVPDGCLMTKEFMPCLGLQIPENQCAIG